MVQIPTKVPVMAFSKESQLSCMGDSRVASHDEVRRALEDYGCFIVELEEGHPSREHAEIFEALKGLFDLPFETKKENSYDKPFHGYVGRIPFYPLYESMGIDNAATPHGTQTFTNLMWPEGNDLFYESVQSCSMLLAEVLETVTRMVFESYGVERWCESYIGSTSYLLRLMKYRVPLLNETTNGFVTHTDKSFLTVLHQNEINGLELETRTGEWIRFELSSSSFLVIAGDAAMAWSNANIHSPKHRVVMNGSKTRYSLALFSFFERMVETPAELVDIDRPLKFRPFDHLEFLKFYYTDEGREAEKTVRAINVYCGI